MQFRATNQRASRNRRARAVLTLAGACFLSHLIASGCARLVQYPVVTSEGKIRGGDVKTRMLLATIVELHTRRVSADDEYVCAVYCACISPHDRGFYASGTISGASGTRGGAFYVVTSSPDSIEQARVATISRFVISKREMNHTWFRLLWNDDLQEWSRGTCIDVDKIPLPIPNKPGSE